jgi:large subunit ribosomal protein L4e
MKLEILDAEGNKKKEIETGIFDGVIREDIVQKVIETEKKKQPNSNFYLAGKQHAAAGKIRHGRRRWKTAAGRGISRIPRKIFWRRGTQFYWEGATVSGTRGGRRAHPPKTIAMINTKKVNKKEAKIAFLSALAMSTSLPHLKEKYSTLKDKETKLPIVVEDKILDLKTKEIMNSIKKILKDFADVAVQKKKVRAGKGKMRGRKYKKSAGMLLVIGKEEERKIGGIEVKKADEIKTSDLASNGARLTVYTEKSIIDLEERMKIKKEKKVKEKRKKKRKRREKKEKTKEKKKNKVKNKEKK